MQAPGAPECRDIDVNDKTDWQICDGGWSVNLTQQAALHESGFRLDFNGHPSSRNFDVQPSGLASNVSAVEWAGMLRQGTDEYRRAFARVEQSDAAVNADVDADMDYGMGLDESPVRPARKPVITVKRKRQIS